MATQIVASSKGQVVLPKRVRDRLGIASGTRLDVIDTPTGVELRPAGKPKNLSVDEAIARLQTAVGYDGPRIDEADWARGMEAFVREKWQKRLK